MRENKREWSQLQLRSHYLWHCCSKWRVAWPERFPNVQKASNTTNKIINATYVLKDSSEEAANTAYPATPMTSDTHDSHMPHYLLNLFIYFITLLLPYSTWLIINTHLHLLINSNNRTRYNNSKKRALSVSNLKNIKLKEKKLLVIKINWKAQLKNQYFIVSKKYNDEHLDPNTANNHQGQDNITLFPHNFPSFYLKETYLKK